MYEFDEDDEAVLTCNATGSPPVDITWQYEGMDITSDGSSVTITNSFGVQSDLILTTGRLTYSSIQRSMAGTYTCVASNGIGSSEEVNATVTVKCKCTDWRVWTHLFTFFLCRFPCCYTSAFPASPP